MIIGDPFLASSVIGKSLVEGEKEIFLHQEMSKKELQRKLENDMMYVEKQFLDSDFNLEEKPSFGKSKKQMRNNRNPQRIKAKYKGKSNPFNKK